MIDLELDPLEVTAAAIAQAERNANERWKDAALAALEATARKHASITALDFWAEFKKREGDFAVTGTHRLCASGAIFRRAMRARIIERTNRFATGPSCGVGARAGHIKALPIYKSLVYWKHL